jgi:sarcosine oxidase subunit beta
MPSTAWGGLEGDAHDGVPLIGPAPGVQGLYIAVGFSGHGFQLAPAVGDAVAEAIRSGTQPEALRELTP